MKTMPSAEPHQALPPFEPAYREALAWQQAGELPRAIARLEALRAQAPTSVPVLSALATALRQVGRPEEARAHFEAALRADDAIPGLWFNYGNCLQALGDHPGAETAFRRALALDPALLPAQFNLANLLRDRGRLDEAEQHYRQVLALDPRFVRAHTNLGNLLRTRGRAAEAVAAHRQALALVPDEAAVHINLGNALRDTGEFPEAIARYRQALRLDPRAVRAAAPLAQLLYERGDEAERPELLALYRRLCALEPADPEPHNALGVVLQEANETDAALAAFRRALAIQPDHAAALNNLGTLLRMLRRPQEGLPWLRRAVALHPASSLAQVNLAYVLHDLGQVSEMLAVCRSIVERDPANGQGHLMLGLAYSQQARLPEAHESFLAAHRCAPDSKLPLCNALFASLYRDDLDAAAIIRLHRELAAKIPCPLPVRRRWPNPPKPERRLRVGYLSPDLRYHPVASFLAPLLAHHDRDQVEVTGYADHPAEDAMTVRLRGYAARWRRCHGLSDAQLAEQIAADGIDLLVDLAGHTAGNRASLLKAKPAPLQVLYIGYPGTSGLATLDYLISDRWVSPPDKDDLYTETVSRQPGSFWCFEPPEQAPPVGPPPVQGNGYVTFGSFNNLPKLSPTTVALWARVLQAVPAGRLVLQALAFADASTRERVRERFAACGIAPERLHIRELTLAFDRFLTGYGEIDIALDPLPFNGGTTTCQALWMGVPVITLPGEHFYSRMGLSVLRHLELDELVADSAAAYVRIAAALAADRERLAALRRTLRERMRASALCDGPGAARALETSYRAMWRAWCAGQGRAGAPGGATAS